MATTTKEIAKEILPFIRVYKDGSAERLIDSPHVPPSLDQETGVSSKDITISKDPKVSARLYLPKLTHPNHKLSIFVHFHGGGFCFGSAFSSVEHRYINALVSQAQVLAVSVEYRLAPEHLFPAAYEDCWHALQWVASHSVANALDEYKEKWILDHGYFQRVFIGGDSAGGNIVHNMAMKAGTESLPGDVKILGAIISHPHFWGLEPIGNERREGREKVPAYTVWELFYPSAPFGVDNPMLNPTGPGAPSLAGLGCSRVLVSVAEKDSLRDRGVWYYHLVKESGWKGEIELYEAEGEEHVFHVKNPEKGNGKAMISRLASFLKK